MFDTAVRPLTGIAAVVDQLLATVTAMTPAALQATPDPELLSALRQLQQVANLVDTAEQTVLAHVIAEQRLADHVFSRPADLVVDTMRVTRAVAAVRVRRAARNQVRTTLTGQVLPAKYEQLAAAQVAGEVSGAHADRVTTWLDKIEPHATLTQFAAAEAALVRIARTASPDQVDVAGYELLRDLDPDGPAPRDLDKRRGISLGQAADGTGRINGTLTPELLAKLQTVLDPLAAPRPENPDTGERDTRGTRMRMHDALEELTDRTLQTDTSNHGGIPLTLVVIMEIEQFLAKIGTARTAFGTTIPVQRLLTQAAEAQIIPVVLSKVDGVLAYGRTRRIASEGQALALIARDRGCTFPGCQRPAVWCQRHHIQEFVADDGETDLENLVLVCGHHHRHFKQHGWSVELRYGRAWWTPPATVDPDRRPLRNDHHHPPDTALS